MTRDSTHCASPKSCTTSRLERTGGDPSQTPRCRRRRRTRARLDHSQSPSYFAVCGGINVSKRERELEVRGRDACSSCGCSSSEDSDRRRTRLQSDRRRLCVCPARQVPAPSTLYWASIGCRRHRRERCATPTTPQTTTTAISHPLHYELLF